MYIGGVPLPLRADIVAPAPGGGPVRPETYNFLPYVASDGGTVIQGSPGWSYTGPTIYQYPEWSLDHINDGNFDVGVNAFQSLPLIMTFAAPVYLNRIVFTLGQQYNYAANHPVTATFYRGSSTSPLLVHTFATDGFTAELFANPAFNTASATWRIDFINPASFSQVAIRELQAYGALA
jgi:hypothetical protein